MKARIASYFHRHPSARFFAPFCCLLFLLVTVSLSSALLAQDRNLPRLEKHGDQYQMQVDGKPFFILGAQVHNSSGFPATMDAAWSVLHAIHCNTVSVPVY